MKLLFSLVFTLLLIAACSADKKKDSKDGGKNSGGETNAFSSLSITNPQTQDGLQIVNHDNQAIPAATIYLNNDFTSPLLADQNGFVAFPKDWTNEKTVTIEAAGFLQTTYIGVSPVSQALHLNEVDGQQALNIQGLTTEYGRLRRDGFIDFSLIIPALTRRQMLNFDVSSVISPITDKISVAGQTIEIPSNISLPKQRESYIIPITISKPLYTMTVRRPGFYKMFATHGKFPLNKVVGALRNGQPIFDVINHFEFIGGGQKDLQVEKNMVDQDIAVNELLFDQSITVIAPTIPAGKEVLSLALVNQGGYFFPTDLKRASSKQVLDLKYPASQKEAYSLSVLMKKGATSKKLQDLNDVDIYSLLTLNSFGVKKSKDQSVLATEGLNQISIAFEKADSQKEILFLSNVEPPIVEDNRLLFSPPATISDIQTVSTYVILSEIEEIPSGQFKTERRTRLWELFAQGWIEQMDLPQLALNLDPNKKYRWEVLFLGRSNNALISGGGSLLDDITHISRNSVDF